MGQDLPLPSYSVGWGSIYFECSLKSGSPTGFSVQRLKKLLNEWFQGAAPAQATALLSLPALARACRECPESDPELPVWWQRQSVASGNSQSGGGTYTKTTTDYFTGQYVPNCTSYQV